MTFDRWQAPDRDSPTTVEFEAKVELGLQLDAIMQAEGRQATREEVVREASGVELSRPRRWHKMFERMGLLYQDEHGNTQLTDLGGAIRAAKANAGREFRRALASSAISVLRKYQLQNPADVSGGEGYPADTDIHPYWAIWKAAVELDGKLHWDELNRELMWVFRHSELDEVIARIRQARSEPNYDPVEGGSGMTRLRERAYNQETTTDRRDPAGQVRDQKTTPWFKRAGLGELLLIRPGSSGNGYWSVHPDVLDILEHAVAGPPPEFRYFNSEQEWFAYFGSLAERVSSTPEVMTGSGEFSELYDLLLERGNVVFFGPPGTGKTHASLAIAEEWEENNGPSSVFNITFHPSYGYEDFIQGYRPAPNGSSSFVLTKGVLILAAERAEALRPAGKAVLLFIDEINRGDVARIFGELITYIERDKRGVTCFLAQQPDRGFSIPDNLYFLGTMNTADKSVSLLDVAMRRRFAFVEFPPDSRAFEEIPSWVPSVSGISLRSVLDILNVRLESVGIESDRSVGHALLRIDVAHSNPMAALRRSFEFDIVPLVAEYCHLERSRIQRVLGGLVDSRGKLSAKNDAEFENALRAWLGILEGDAGQVSNDGAFESHTENNSISSQ